MSTHADAADTVRANAADATDTVRESAEDVTAKADAIVVMTADAAATNTDI